MINKAMFFGSLLGAILFVIWLAVTTSNIEDNREKECSEKGGIYFESRSNSICIDAKSVIGLRQ